MLKNFTNALLSDVSDITAPTDLAARHAGARSPGRGEQRWRCFSGTGAALHASARRWLVDILQEDFYLIWCNCVPEQNNKSRICAFFPPVILIFLFFKTRMIIFVNLIQCAVQNNKLDHAIALDKRSTNMSRKCQHLNRNYTESLSVYGHTERYQKHRCSTPLKPF